MPWFLRYIPFALGLLVLALMALEVRGRPTAADAAPFHLAAEKAVASIPVRIGEWEGTDIPVPVSAQALLKPNALLSRVYLNRTTNEEASLTLVQCRDTRDMAGHYPPICYPAQGWTSGEEAKPVTLDVGGLSIQAVRYQFRRSAFDHERTLVIYNFFAVPGRGYPSDMDAIRSIASDYTARPFGAAQIQVGMGVRRGMEEELRVVQALLSPCRAALEVLSDPSWIR